ncbi:protein kinase domain protein [Ichthyophthirius multifiliis]|uniref:Protein kinase domain protein n=1 Tax=Ichthyophthirius multifiliis TaxID=5932 RepID=G0QLF2_ICHMU|nr:protein kinase domain protein [Ichthyophthirius multifiliis]EGR33946.1 protein kinase domain protein [Ichthyophthirius multifiliis]|eukprot:XP_004039250.1 protein kinase domain protein [Ichthyophthirius multifiliis]
MKLGDFGITKTGDYLQSNVSTYSYMAPDMIDLNNLNYNQKVDIWALGQNKPQINLLQQMLQVIPENRININEVLKQVNLRYKIQAQKIKNFNNNYNNIV